MVEAGSGEHDLDPHIHDGDGGAVGRLRPLRRRTPPAVRAQHLARAAVSYPSRCNTQSEQLRDKKKASSAIPMLDQELELEEG